MERKRKQTNNFAGATAVFLALLVSCSWAVRVSEAAQIINYSIDDTVAYNWVDISGTGTDLGMVCDDCEAQITLPFAFGFYGTPYTTMWVGTNGAMSFTDSNIDYDNQCLPATNQTTLIAPFQDDLDTYSGAVYWEVQGSAPNRQVIVQWHNINHLYMIGSTTFQAILYEGSNRILFQYQDVDFVDGYEYLDNGASATVGVQRDSTMASQYSCNTPALAAGKAILFTPTNFDLTLSASYLGVCGGTTGSLTGTVENESGSAQTYALSSSILGGTGAIFGPPATLNVPDGGTGSFTVTVRPDSDSGPILASVTASQGGQVVKETAEINIEQGLWLAETGSEAGSWAPAVAAHGNSLYQIGGYDSDWNQTAAVYRYDTVTKTWAARADLPVEVTETNAATIGDRIYVPGGNGSSGYLNTLHIYNTASNTWSAGAPLPVYLAYASVVTDGQKLYVVGGYDTQNSDKIYIYNPALDSWTTGADMPADTGGYYASGACIGGKIYVAGGVVGSSSVDTLATQVYTIATNTWGTAPDLPDPGLASYDGGWSAYNGGVLDSRYFVVFGGDNEYWECSRKAVMFDTQDGHWEEMGDLNSCLIGSKGASVGNVFYRIGGEKDYSSFDMSTEYYSQCKGFPWPMFLPAIEHGAATP